MSPCYLSHQCTPKLFETALVVGSLVADGQAVSHCNHVHHNSEAAPLVGGHCNKLVHKEVRVAVVRKVLLSPGVVLEQKAGE